MKFHPRDVVLMLQRGIWLLVFLPFGSVSSQEDTSTTANPNINSKIITPDPNVNSIITPRNSNSKITSRKAKPEESTAWFERYGVPEIKGLDITCSSASYDDGNKCEDGKTVKGTDKKLRVKKLDPWYHPDNDVKLKQAEDVAKSCSSSCKSGMCYFSLGKYFDYICGSTESSDYKETVSEIKRIRAKHKEYRLLDDGRICWDGPLMGMEYHEKLITKEDTARASWYEKSVPKPNLRSLQTELSKYCKNKNCELSPEKSTFICGSGPPTAKPLSFFILILLGSSSVIRYPDL